MDGYFGYCFSTLPTSCPGSQHFENGTYKGNRVLSCKWSAQLPLFQRLTLSLRQASCTPRPPGFHQGQWSGQVSFCFSSYPFKGI